MREFNVRSKECCLRCGAMRGIERGLGNGNLKHMIFVNMCPRILIGNLCTISHLNILITALNNYSYFNFVSVYAALLVLRINIEV